MTPTEMLYLLYRRFRHPYHFLVASPAMAAKTVLQLKLLTKMH
jgi:hypothetical protein